MNNRQLKQFAAATSETPRLQKLPSKNCHLTIMRNCGNETVTNWWPFIYDLLIPHTLHNHDSLMIFLFGNLESLETRMQHLSNLLLLGEARKTVYFFLYWRKNLVDCAACFFFFITSMIQIILLKFKIAPLLDSIEQ